VVGFYEIVGRSVVAAFIMFLIIAILSLLSLLRDVLKLWIKPYHDKIPGWCWMIIAFILYGFLMFMLIFVIYYFLP
jgi:uncharacterized BrkB/YihY/UPF0761 family membrane protein